MTEANAATDRDEKLQVLVAMQSILDNAVTDCLRQHEAALLAALRALEPANECIGMADCVATVFVNVFWRFMDDAIIRQDIGPECRAGMTAERLFAALQRLEAAKTAAAQEAAQAKAAHIKGMLQ